MRHAERPVTSYDIAFGDVDDHLAFGQMVIAYAMRQHALTVTAFGGDKHRPRLRRGL